MTGGVSSSKTSIEEDPLVKPGALATTVTVWSPSWIKLFISVRLNVPANWPAGMVMAGGTVILLVVEQGGTSPPRAKGNWRHSTSLTPKPPPSPKDTSLG